MKFKTPEVEKRFYNMHPEAQKLAYEMDKFASSHFNIELVITATVSTQEEDYKLNRVSDSHRTGRAFDIRTRDLPDSFIAQLIHHFKKLYNKSHGAIANGRPSLIVNKPHGSGPHLHVQLNRSYTWPKPEIKNQNLLQ